MKRIITLAVIITVLIPAMAAAQTPSLNGYDEYTKTDIVEWIEDAIDAGFVQFDTQQHETDFLSLVQQILAARDAENWSVIVTLAAQLETAAGYIVGESHRSLAVSLCQILAEMYSDSTVMFVIEPNLEAGIIGDLMQAPDSTRTTILVEKYHIVYGDGFECIDVAKWDGSWYHFDDCDNIYVPVRQEE